jgi:hypothetical protein
MKPYLIFSLSLILSLSYACQQSAENPTPPAIVETEFNESEEKTAIMAVINGETKCFFERDYDCWIQHWIHEDYALQAWNNSDGTFSAADGWAKINSQGKNYIDNVPEGKTKTSHPIVKREKIHYKFYGDNGAYLTWKQYNSDRKNEFYSVSHETRVMEKKEGAWRIVNMTAFWDSVNKIPFADIEL